MVQTHLKSKLYSLHLTCNPLNESTFPLHIQVTKGQHERAFFSLPEFEHWKEETDNAHTWKVKYYKGLGTSTAKEAKEYFSDMERHRVPFRYSGPEDDDAIQLVSLGRGGRRGGGGLSEHMEGEGRTRG